MWPAAPGPARAQGVWRSLDTTATNYVGAAGQFGNTTFNIYQTATTAGLILNNTAVTLAGGTTDLRLKNTSTVNLYSGTLNFQGSNTASTTTVQNLAALNAAGGSFINVTAGTGSNADTLLALAAFNRRPSTKRARGNAPS